MKSRQGNGRKKSLGERPEWAERALQGVAYWIGHRRSLYSDYPLAEGALVAEICNLIHANLPSDLHLICEVQYSEFIEGHPKTTVLTQKARVDLLISETGNKNPDRSRPKFIIEVKRASAHKAQINADLLRLHEVKSNMPAVRALMFLIAEERRPNRFVDESGKSRLGRQEIPNCDGYFRVRRTCKAAHAFTKRDHAQYACLLEVYSD
jgi:hypothetical protein